MSDALRELLASFVVEVDKAGELAKGNDAVSALKARLAELQTEFAKVKAPAAAAGKAIRDALSPDDHVRNAIASAAARARNSDAIAHLTGGGGAGGDGFLGAGLGAGKVAQFGPTRDTLNAGRAQMRAAEQATAAYAQTLRGKLASAVNAVRAGFNGGGGGQGPGLLATLGTVRNGLIALGVGAAARAVVHLVDGIGDIRESAQRLGVTTDAFQRLRVLAEQNGTSVEALGTAFRTLANVAVQPTKESAAALTRLGISAKDAKGEFKPTNELFFEVAGALADVGNEAQRSALAQDLLGRSAQELKPIFAGGRAEIDKQRQALGAMNVLSNETIAQADDLSDSWKALGPSLLAAAEPLLKLLLPALVDLTTWVSKGVDWLGKFLKKTDFTSVALAALGLVLATHVVPWLSLMIGLGGGVTATMLGMAGAAARSALAFLAWAIPAAIIEDFIGFLRGDDSAIGEALDMIFGKGASTGVIEALGKAWDFLASAVKRVLEAMHLFKPGDEDLEQRDRADKSYEGSNFQRKVFPILKSVVDGLVPGLGTLAGAGVDALVSGTSSSEYGSSSIPAPGGSLMSDGSNMPPARNISIGDSVVNISMGPSATAADVGRAASGALESGNERLLASYAP